MANQYNNEVIYNGQTLINLKNDTVTPEKVLSGETFHDKSGAPQTGSMITHNVYDGLDSSSTDDALSANMGKLLNSNLGKFKIHTVTVTTNSAGSAHLNLSTSKIVLGGTLDKDGHFRLDTYANNWWIADCSPNTTYTVTLMYYDA